MRQHRALVTGSAGLVGSAVAELFLRQGWQVIGIDNYMRAELFGVEADNASVTTYLAERYADYLHVNKDIRAPDAYDHAVGPLNLIVHTAGQPSHDWAAEHVWEDWEINATATLRLLEWYRHTCPEAVFIYMSTNKVYGDCINRFEFDETPTRWEPTLERLYMHGADEDLPVDKSMHSLFGVSKTAADLAVQEFGRYFGLRTLSFRCGCLTGGEHRGVQQHGFLAYLSKCVKECRTYTVIGYDGKQVRDNLHAQDVATACWSAYCAMQERPQHGAVYNLGGGRANSISVLEAISWLQDLTGKYPPIRYEPLPRKGDHIWWISNTTRFEEWTAWRPEWNLEMILQELANG